MVGLGEWCCFSPLSCLPLLCPSLLAGGAAFLLLLWVAVLFPLRPLGRCFCWDPAPPRGGEGRQHHQKRRGILAQAFCCSRAGARIFFAFLHSVLVCVEDGCQGKDGTQWKHRRDGSRSSEARDHPQFVGPRRTSVSRLGVSCSKDEEDDGVQDHQCAHSPTLGNSLHRRWTHRS